MYSATSCTCSAARPMSTSLDTTPIAASVPFFTHAVISYCVIAATLWLRARYAFATSTEPSRPPSSAAYQWNSTVFAGAKPTCDRRRNASRMVTVPEPSSSAPGERSSGWA
jgi:hypothetical protein